MSHAAYRAWRAGRRRRQTMHTWFDRAVVQRAQIIRLLPEAGLPLVAALGFLDLLLGLLPVVFVVSSSVVVGRSAQAAAASGGSAQWHAVLIAFAAAAGSFLLQQLLAPTRLACAELLARRIDGRLFRRLMTAALRTPGNGPLEDEALLDRHAEASRELDHSVQSPGKAGAGMSALIARYVQLAGYSVAVGVTLSWPAAAAVAAVVLVFRHAQRGGLRRYSAILDGLAAQRRRGNYLRDLSIEPAAGKEIRIFGLAGWLRDRYAEAYLGWLTLVWAQRRRIYLRPYLVYAAIGLAVATAVLVGAGVTAARSSSPSLTALVLTLQAALAAFRLGDHYPEADVQTQFGMMAYDSLRAFEQGVASYEVRTESDRRGTRQTTSDEAASPAKAIRFEDVSFRYPGGRLVLDRLTMDIPVGRSTAVVGANGAGKSTVVKLLARLHDPTGGTILVDDVPLGSLAVEAWRRRMAVIFQDPVHYELSAADNIAFGAIEQLDDREGVVWAAREAGIDEVLEGLPKRYDTPLARHLPGGAELSGGQWQRIAIARALFAARHGATVFVLDEPTASLDVRAEARFYTDFVTRMRGMTTILISHRFSTVRHADNIVVLDDGRLLEEGSHGDLMGVNGRYAELFRLQASRFGHGGGAKKVAPR